MYQLPILSFTFQDLEPYIDTHTMGLHYHKHEQNYLNKLNDLLKQSNYDFRYPLDELFYHLNEFPNLNREEILYNLGGVLNHNLYWKGISPNANKPFGYLKQVIEKTYGSYEQFWKSFKEKALQLKGSGYTFLVLKMDGNLDIINVVNQVTPLSLGYVPLFTIDMWEHAYYLNYKNNKAEYLDNFEQIADFTYASEKFNQFVK